MKNKRLEYQSRKERRILIGFCITFVVVSALMSLIFVTGESRMIDGQPRNAAEVENELESYLMQKLTSKDILPGFSPIIIYRYSPTTHDATVAGSGTLFVGDNGTQLVTCAHVFSVKDNGPTNQYAIRRLRPFEGHHIDFGIEAICSDEKNFADYKHVGTDIVMCKVGPRPQPIASFYENEREEAEKQLVTQMIPLKEAHKITSLTSGEDIPIIGIGKKLANGLQYFIAIKSTRPGESGKAFRDDRGDLYIVKGTATTLSITPDAAKMLGYPTDAKCTVVVGPLNRQK